MFPANSKKVEASFSAKLSRSPYSKVLLQGIQTCFRVFHSKHTILVVITILIQRQFQPLSLNGVLQDFAHFPLASPADTLRCSAPVSPADTLQYSAPASPADTLRCSAPVSPADTLRCSAPASPLQIVPARTKSVRRQRQGVPFIRVRRVRSDACELFPAGSLHGQAVISDELSLKWLL